MNAYRHTTLVAVVLTGALAACGGDGGSDSNPGGPSGGVPFDATSVLQNLTDSVITNTYIRLDDQAQALGDAVAALGDGVTPGELDAAQAAWKATRVPWESSEGFLFGPVDSQGIDPLIDTWPLSTEDLQAFLAAGATSMDQILAASENVQGFHAIEFLLFGDGVVGNDQPVGALDAGEIAYLQALVEVLEIHTGALVEGWTVQFDPDNASSGPFADQLKSPGSGRIYTSQSAAIEELLNGLVTIVDEVGNGKIAEPLGPSLAEADTSLVESQYSWNSLTDFHNNVQSVLNVYTGLVGFDPRTNTVSIGDAGLYAFVAAHDPALASEVQAAIVAAYDSIALIDGDGDPTTTDITSGSQMPFRQAILDPAGRDRCQTAIDLLQALQDLINSRVMPLLAQTDFAA